MRVVVLGASGMLGHKLMQRLEGRCNPVGTVRESASAFQDHPILGGMSLRGGIHATDFDSITRLYADIRPDVVVNCIGIIKQRSSVESRCLAISVNSLLPHRLHELSRAAGCRLIQVSTDCVFSGDNGPYTEDDNPDPVDVYGRTKLLGEVAGSGALTLRTSIIGREIRNCHGLLEWFLGNRGGEVEGFTHALFSGLTTVALAKTIVELIVNHPSLEGVWHVSSEGIDKFTLLKLINRHLDLNISVNPTDAPVCDRRLDGSRFTAATGLGPASWDEMIAELAQDSTHYNGA